MDQVTESQMRLHRPATLSRQVYVGIRRLIREGQVVHDSLYSEAQIVNMMGSSRTPVREALIELTREGIIEKLPQRGFRLRHITDKERRETFLVRGLLESHLAERMARERTPDQVASMRSLLDEQAKSLADPVRFLEIDEEFHVGMAITLALHRVQQALLVVRGISWVSGIAALNHPTRMTETLAEHKEIIDAIEAGDQTRAASAVDSHIRKTEMSGDLGMRDS